MGDEGTCTFWGADDGMNSATSGDGFRAWGRGGEKRGRFAEGGRTVGVSG
jgi:hypothetical protein